jgi:septum site-determining protein MinC
MTDSALIQIKGIKEGLLISFGNSDWNILHQALFEQIEKQNNFFNGARIAIDVQDLSFKSRDLGKLRDKLSDLNVSLWAVLSTNETTINSSQLLGLATALSKPIKHREPTPERTEDEHLAYWVQKTLRSGTRIEYSGNVFIFGDVNSGAEVIAGGSVVVWGRVRGVVHAGTNGDKNAVICALDMSPTQIRICGEIAVSPPKKDKPYPEIVKIIDGHLTAEPWVQSK